MSCHELRRPVCRWFFFFSFPPHAVQFLVVQGRAGQGTAEGRAAGQGRAGQAQNGRGLTSARDRCEGSMVGTLTL